MNNMQISTDPQLLSVDLPESLTTSPSVSTFMPEEEASTCLLLPGTPSPPLNFTHPLTPNIQDGGDLDTLGGDDPAAETSSSGSSGIGMGGNGNGTANLFNNHSYLHLKKKSEGKLDNGGHQNGIPMSKDMPCFVHWNWPVIRKCTFFVFLSGIFAMCAIVVAMMVNLPKTCNPPVAWYKGSVFYEIFPASFQDSNNDGLGDLKGIASRADYLKNLGVGAVRLNSIFPSKHYPDHFQDVTSLTEVDDVLGNIDDLKKLSATLHERNISLVLDLPIFPFIRHLDPSTINQSNKSDENPITSEFLRLSRAARSVEENAISNVMRFWMSRAAVDGFYIKGLENYFDDPLLMDNIREWKYLLGSDRILIVNKKLIDIVDDHLATEILMNVDLVDVFLDISNGTETLSDFIKEVIEGKLMPGTGPWIHWSMGGVEERRVSSGLSPNASLAAILMELMLPGTPSIFYGDEIALEEVHDPLGEHAETKHLHHLSTMMWDGQQAQFTARGSLPWLPRSASVSFQHLEYVVELIRVRKRSPSIYQNVVIKEGIKLLNINIRSSKNDLLVIERWYPRRNSFVAISNFGTKMLSLDLSAMFYSGEMISGSSSKNSKVYFSEFEIKSLETLIVKLHK